MPLSHDQELFSEPMLCFNGPLSIQWSENVTDPIKVNFQKTLQDLSYFDYQVCELFTPVWKCKHRNQEFVKSTRNQVFSNILSKGNKSHIISFNTTLNHARYHI